jgi:phosphoglycerol transferase
MGESSNPAPPAGGAVRAVAAAAATALITVAAMVQVLDLRHRDLSVPFGYGEDNMFVLTWVKALVDDGWWSHSARVGAPGRMDMGNDFPQYPHLHFVLMKALTAYTADAVTLTNLYFLAGFPLVALAALAALRAVGIGHGPCVAGAVLYAFLPYHFVRGVWHLFLAGYFMVPLLFLVVIWVIRGHEFLVVRRTDGRLGLEFRSPRAIVSLLICVALGFDFPYYPVLGGPFLALAGVIACFMGGGRPVLYRAGLLTAVLAVSFLIDVSPSVLTRLRIGPNPSGHLVANHPWVDSETLGLTLTQMLLPAANHPVPQMRAIRDRFYASSPIVGEGDAVALGTVGSVGLLLALGCVVCCPRATGRGRIYYVLGLLTVFSILVASAGGVATLFALVGTGLMRSYNRVSIFIAFPALAVGFGLLEHLLRLPGRRLVQVSLGVAVPAIVLLFGLFDQTATTYVHDPKTVKPEYENDAEFFGRVEAAVPPGTMVYQLPYIGFLSYTNATVDLKPYYHFRGFLHTRHVRWSFGATHGRRWDGVHADIAARPLTDGLRRLAVLNFGGVYVDRFGYADRGRAVEAELARLTGATPIVSGNGRMAFYDIRAYAARTHAGVPDAEWKRERQSICDSPRIYWGSDFDPEESDGTNRWKWCRAAKSELVFVNPTREAVWVTIEFSVETAHNDRQAGVLTLSKLVAKEVPFDGGAACAARVQLPPGRHVIELSCPVRQSAVPGRTIFFGIYNFRFRIETARPESADARGEKSGN